MLASICVACICIWCVDVHTYVCTHGVYVCCTYVSCVPSVCCVYDMCDMHVLHFYMCFMRVLICMCFVYAHVWYVPTHMCIVCVVCSVLLGLGTYRMLYVSYVYACCAYDVHMMYFVHVV